MNIVTEHYKANYRKLIKRMTFRAGTEWDAEDIVQQAYTYALMYYKNFDGGNFNNWFTTILNNTFRDFKNSEKGITTASFEEDECEGVPCSHYADRVVAEIDALIKTKNEEQIEILTLFFKQGYTAVDIARITEYSYQAARQTISRFRKELKELYG